MKMFQSWLRGSLWVVGVGLLVGVGPQARGQILLLGANLDSNQEVPQNSSPATGNMQLTLDTITKAFSLDMTLVGLSTSGLRAAGPNGTPFHIHNNVPGANGPIVFDIGYYALTQPNGIVQDVDSGVQVHAEGILMGVQGNLDLSTLSPPRTTGDVVGALVDGAAYVNVHTNSFPGGEIRGDIFVVPEPTTLSLLAVGLALTGLRRRSSL